MLEGHCHTILTISQWDSIILTGSKDQTIRGWDSRTGKQVFILYGHKSGVNRLLVHSDLLISGSWDGSVIFWELETQRKLKELKPHNDWVTELKLQQPSTLWTAGNDGLLNKIDLKTLTILKTHQISNSYIWAFDVSSDFAVAATNDKNITIWDLNTFEIVLSFKAHKTQINHVSFINNGEVILSNGRDDGVVLWNSRTGQVIEKIHSVGRAKFLKKTEEGKFLAVTRENQVLIWDLQLKKEMKRMKIGSEGEYVLKFFVEQEKMWFARDYFVSVLDLITGSEEKVTENLPVLNEVILNHSDKVILGKAEEGKVTVWDLNGFVLATANTEEEARVLEKSYPGLLSLFNSPIK
jgi:WD40 repeat protein